jgi:hypothetical protein
MVYLETEQLQALRAEARKKKISLAELLRRLVQEHFTAPSPPPPVSVSTYLKLVGLGSSGRKDIAERHDAYLGEALRREHAR